MAKQYICDNCGEIIKEKGATFHAKLNDIKDGNCPIYKFEASSVANHDICIDCFRKMLPSADAWMEVWNGIND